MSAEQDKYLAVLKASYDYEPQAEDEIEVKEDQLLFLLEKTDDDWWRVKCKSDNPDEEGPTGLVPSAYVEEAEQVGTVKALYDYEPQAPGELNMKEDEVLILFAKEEDWWLVQSKSEGGVGYVPATYVEETTGGAPSPPAAPSIANIVVPPSPPRPASTYVDPADRVAASKASSDDIQTWSVSEVDKKGKKKKGTLGVGNGAVFFASESDKTPVQKWPTAAISSSKIDKSKHVLIEISDLPTSLHFHAHSKDIAEAIVAKLESSKALSAPALSPASTPPERAVTPKVHFAEEAPEVIPPREPSFSEDGEAYEEPEPEPEPEPEVQQVEEEPVHGAEGGEGEEATALYDFTADGEDELSVAEGETLVVLEKDGDEWWKCRNARGEEGVVPAQYLELQSGGASAAAPAAAEEPDDTADEEAAAAEAERLKQERIQREKAEKAAKDQAKQRAQAAAAADAERQRKEKERRVKEAEEQRKKAERAAKDEERRSSTSSPARDPRKSTERSEGRERNGSTSRSSTERRGPPPEQCRTWRDRSGQFTVEAALLGYQNGKLRLHKANGIIIEVPSEKMSQTDMDYVKKMLGKKSGRSSTPADDDDQPLAERRRSLQPQPAAPPPAKKKGPTVDWFEFFLNAGCDIDDCTRYAQSFERDKIDEAILPDITESTMRSLGLREGDIIRVKKAIAAKQPKAQGSADAEQLRKDEELARQLQAAEESGNGRKSSPAPNLFAAGPNGALKSNVRRGRPQPSKSLPPSSVDLNAISTASDQIQRTGTPGSASAVSPPARSNSAAPVASGFDDDAWTNRPSSTKPVAPTPAAAVPAPPPAPPAPAAPAAPAVDPVPARAPSAPVTSMTQPQSTGGSGGSLAKTTESDIFDQLARLSELRAKSPPQSSFSSTPNGSMLGSPGPSLTPSISYQSGLGMRSSPAPMGQHLQAQQTGMMPPPQQQNGPRGPFAPVPANQSLLQPLVPTQTGLTGFVPTRPASTSSPFQPQPQQPSFLNTQPTGFAASPMMSQPTGFQGPMMSQPTGFPGQGPMMSQPTGFPGSFGQQQSPFGNNASFGVPQSVPNGLNMFGQFGGASPVPTGPPSAAPKDTSPANIFAQMKSGTFASDNDTGIPQPADKYDALRPAPPLAMQATGWGGYQGVNGFQAYPGYQR
ncbi:hypothetical protein OE88DRAFT_1652089 [Heliocybe sulcata]|uniref:Actin cytoskeleton-regulatory complex protein SLA1 n=1 Tax=Heliocybe sulcata TaxID=5364 RepID=A0A5C3NPR4_9AGAM|nr:hypothetical protein OE88DRAFT_1652089 [Heliocybe sulcata]